MLLRKSLIAVLTVLCVAMLITGCVAPAPAVPTVAPAEPTAAPAAAEPAAAAETWTPEEVKAGSGVYQVTPIAAIPKKLKKEYLLAFINPGMNIPFFVEWSKGMNAAAKFYGVKLIESDLQLKYEDTVTQYNQLAAKNPDIYGTLTTSGTALKQAADADGKIVIPIDIPIEGDPYFIGVPNTRVGELGGETLWPALKAKLDGEWKGKRLVYMCGSNTGCVPCVERCEAGLATLRKYVDIPDENVIMLETQGLTDLGRTTATDALTANPDAVFAVLAHNDECGVGILQAAQNSDREKDMLLVTLGGDPLARTELRKKSPTYVAAVDFNPWAEAWNWVEAAIITLEGGTFQPYDVYRTLTPENVDEFYPGEK